MSLGFIHCHFLLPLALFHALVCPNFYDLTNFLVGLPASSFFLYITLYWCPISLSETIHFLFSQHLLVPAMTKEQLGAGDMAEIGEIYSMLFFHLGNQFKQCDYMSHYLVIAAWLYDLEYVA